MNSQKQPASLPFATEMNLEARRSFDGRFADAKAMIQAARRIAKRTGQPLPTASELADYRHLLRKPL